MVTPISGGTAFDFGAAAQATAAPPQTTPAPARQPARIEPPADTVKLSPSAQVHLLKTQGETIPQIEINTALSAQQVEGYLGITQASSPATATGNK